MARSDSQCWRYLTTPTTILTRLGFVISITRSRRSSRSRNSKLSLFLRALVPASMSPSGVSSFSTGSPNPSAAAPKRVGTHNGSFHCDEALGRLMIRLNNKFAGAEIVRTRDPPDIGYSGCCS